MEPDLLHRVDERAGKFGISRSAYILQCIRREIIEGDPRSMNIVAEQAAAYGGQIINNHGDTRSRKKGKG